MHVPGEVCQDTAMPVKHVQNVFVIPNQIATHNTMYRSVTYRQQTHAAYSLGIMKTNHLPIVCTHTHTYTPFNGHFSAGFGFCRQKSKKNRVECGPMPNVMVVNIGGALCSTPQSLADAHY